MNDISKGDFSPYFDDILASSDQCLFLGTWSPYDSRSKLHYHKQLELGLCLSGRGVFYIQGEVYPFCAGDISLIYPWESHIAQSARSAPSNWVFLTVDTDELFKGATGDAVLKGLAFQPLGTGRVLSAEENRSVAFYLNRLISLYNDERYLHCEKRPHYAALLSCFLFESARWEKWSKPMQLDGYGDRLKTIYPAIQYILNHYNEDVNVIQLCECCHLSSAHLRRSFDSIVGVSPIAFLHKIRINHACSALRDSTLSIISVAEQCGYSSLSSFNRQFRKWMNHSPTEYRELNKGEYDVNYQK